MHPYTLTPLHPYTLAPEYFFSQRVKRSVFLITFSGPPKLDETLRKLLKAEKIESYVDGKTSYTHLALHTYKQIRAITIRNLFDRHNAAMLSDKQRIILRNPSDVESSIMFFSRREGETIQGSAFYRRIQEAKHRGLIGQYFSWPATAQEVEECRANKEEHFRAFEKASPLAASAPERQGKKLAGASTPAAAAEPKKGGRQKRIAVFQPSPLPRKTRRGAAGAIAAPPAAAGAIAAPPAAACSIADLPEARPVVLSVEPLEVNDPRYGEIVARCAAQERRLRDMERRLQDLQAADPSRLDGIEDAVEQRLYSRLSEALGAADTRSRLERVEKFVDAQAQLDVLARLERVENVVEAGSVVQEAERQRMAKEFGDRLGKLEEGANILEGDSADHGERLDYLENQQEGDERRLECAEMSISEAADRFDKLEEAREEAEERLKRLEEARIASEARLEGAMALSSASAARDEASKTREDANSGRISELERSLADRLSNIEQRLSWGMLSAGEQLRQDLTERIARAEAAAAGQPDVRGVVGEALRVFHETHLLSKADVNALAQRVLQLEAAGRAETDALRARATELERENAALKAVGRACERERAERSEQMDFLIRNGMMPSISGGPGRELGP